MSNAAQELCSPTLLVVMHRQQAGRFIVQSRPGDNQITTGLDGAQPVSDAGGVERNIAACVDA